MILIVSTIFVLYCLVFLLSLRLRDNSLVDIFWGMGFMIIAVLSYLQSAREIPQILVTILVCLWGIRIVSHIGIRKIKERREDARYAKWRAEWGDGWYFLVRSFLQVHLLQMLLMFVVATPILVVNLIPATPDTLWFALVGAGIALFGVTFEMIADIQLSAFIKIKKPGQIFMTGLYRYSRHPNYFGESMFWLGISIISLPYSYIGIIGWLVITTLLLFVSGVPMQEARYVGRPEWDEYKNRTSVFVPWLPKK